MILKLFTSHNPIPANDYQAVFSALADRVILQQKGGFLFKASVLENEILLGLLPVISEGVRNMHYNISLPNESGFLFSGFFNTDTSFGILPTPAAEKNKQLPDKAELAHSLCVLAQALLEYGLDPDTPLDWISVNILQSFGITISGSVFCKDIPALIKNLGF